ncbi:hypothetical protein MNB_SM-4-1679 [hydrothermal vent metagenome]|uniref:Type I restriction modification DNA specificity domain-containing protein n=1 Tax=hydrothermal vent metagenome TaxID=652676 RepID=A0A1W1CEW9_9ZZZZ
MQNYINEMTKLIQILKEEFPKCEIIALEDIVSKIAVITKVRVGKKCFFNDYDEVTLSHTDHKGILLPYKKGEEFSSLANKTSIYSQSLNAGDILISYRAAKRYAVGRVGDDYKRAIVGNNSAIRIQFNKDIDEEVPSMVYNYLELPFIQEYLKEISSDSNYSRQLLSPEMLLQLPIPAFDVNESFSYSKIHEKRQDMIKELQDISKSTIAISQKLQTSTDKDLTTYNTDVASFKGFLEEQERINNLLKIIEAQLREIDTLIGR